MTILYRRRPSSINHPGRCKVTKKEKRNECKNTFWYKKSKTKSSHSSNDILTRTSNMMDGDIPKLHVHAYIFSLKKERKKVMHTCH